MRPWLRLPTSGAIVIAAMSLAPFIVGQGFRPAISAKSGVFVPLPRLACSLAWIQGPQAHLTHQTLDPLAADRVTALLQLVTYSPAAVERQLQVNLVDVPHQRQVLFADRLRVIVRART